MSRRRWMFLTFVGATLGMTLVLLVHQPVRTQRCAVQAAGGPSLTCENGRLLDWPALSHMAAGAAVGAFLIAGLAWPFIDRR